MSNLISYQIQEELYQTSNPEEEEKRVIKNISLRAFVLGDGNPFSN